MVIFGICSSFTMSQFDGRSHSMEQFVTIKGIDSKQSKIITNATGSAVQLPLYPNSHIFYTNARGESFKVTNKAMTIINIVIFGNNIMFNDQDVQLTNTDP